jgi:nucleotide-binding universal stress UspA family protein
LIYPKLIKIIFENDLHQCQNSLSKANLKLKSFLKQLMVNIMKKILFPTDFSESANNAFVYALQLADKLNASITTIHIFNHPEIYIERGGIHAEALEHIYESIDMEEFENYKDSIPALRAIAEKENLSHIELYHVMEDGAVIPKITRLAKEGSFDMIVMGTKGAGWVKEIFLGTIAGEIMEHADCPVLAVPEKANFDGKINKIAVATEFKAEEKFLLQKVLDLAAAFDAHVYCLNVDLAGIQFYTEQKEEFIKSFIDSPRLHFKTIEGLEIMTALNDYLEKHRMDLICMVIHKRNFIQEFFKYSIPKTMSYHAKIPILSFPKNVLDPKKSIAEKENTV